MVKEVKIDKMDDLIEALGGGGSGSIVPTPTAQDEGKVLTANDDGTASWEDTLPDYSEATQGSVLAKQYSGELGWDRPENLLPQGSLLPFITEYDNGKYLQAVHDDKSGSYVTWASIPIIHKDNITSAGITYDDKAGNAHMSIPSGSVFINMCFKGNSDVIYPVEIENYGTSGTIYISSTEYQRIVDEPDGSFIVCYIN